MGMEPDVRDFLVKIAQTISLVLLWMLINTVIGIRFNYAFFEGRLSLGNIIFYIWFLFSLTTLLIYLKRKWKI